MFQLARGQVEIMQNERNGGFKVEGNDWEKELNNCFKGAKVTQKGRNCHWLADSKDTK